MATTQKVAGQKEVCEGYPNLLSSNLEELRQQGVLCDVTINIGGQSLHAHRTVLAASSSYFMGMFTRGFKESHQDSINIDGNADIFSSLLQFGYTGNLQITYKTAYDIINMANYMQFTQARDTALKYVRKSVTRLSLEDAFKITLLDFVNQQTMRRIRYHLLSKAKELAGVELFLQEANVAYLTALLEKKESAEVNESEVLQMLILWLQHNLDERKQHIPSLMKTINFKKVSEEVLQELISCGILDDYQEILEKAKKTGGTEEKATMITVPISMVKDSNEFKYFNSWDTTELGRVGSWEYLPGIPSLQVGDEYDEIPIKDTFIVAVNGMLYAKYSDEGWNIHFVRYLPNVFEWIELAKIPSDNIRSLIYLNPYIYAIEGEGTMHRYSIHNNIWDEVQSKPTSLYSCNAVATHKGKILVYSQQTIDSGIEDILPYDENHTSFILDVYDPVQNKWTHPLQDKFPPDFNDQVDRSSYPVILEHNGSLYRAVFEKKLNGCCQMGTVIPIVHKLKFNEDKNTITAEVGEEVSQDMIPVNQVGAFQIEEDVFVSEAGEFIHQTNLKAWEDCQDKVDLTPWEQIIHIYREGNFLSYRFDSKLIMDTT